MRVLVVGGGAREHALAWRLSISPSVRKVFCCPGNPGTARCAENLPQADFDGIDGYCSELGIDLVVIGPESPLIQGLATFLRAKGRTVYGPEKGAAAIEGNKAMAKELMREAGIPTAAFRTFTDANAAREYAAAAYAAGRKLVVKASGEAMGKGAIVTSTLDGALAAIDECMVKRSFGESGDTIVIEDKVEGHELSLFSLRGLGGAFLAPAVQDHKPAFDGDKGPNTGGMGARTVIGELTQQELDELGATFCDRAAEALAMRGEPYVGTLYAGLMMTPDGPRCLEYNCRFGDPEVQVQVRLGDDDWGELLFGLAMGRSDLPAPRWAPDTHCVAISLASGGYPESYTKGLPISGIEHAELLDDVVVFHAGTREEAGALVTNGGRVLTVTATGRTLEEARTKAYEAAALIRFEGIHYRTDIGL
jgi:phosphoribosylamine--glycine ligase